MVELKTEIILILAGEGKNLKLFFVCFINIYVVQTHLSCYLLGGNRNVYGICRDFF